jgi:hypothetical protein
MYPLYTKAPRFANTLDLWEWRWPKWYQRCAYQLKDASLLNSNFIMGRLIHDYLIERALGHVMDTVTIAPVGEISVQPKWFNDHGFCGFAESHY